MIHIKAGYRTASGNTMIIEVGGRLLDRTAVPLIDKADYKRLCDDCKGLNGGCARWAPYFEWIKPSQKSFYVVDVKLDMAWAIKYAHRHKHNVIHHNYFRCGYADLLTDRYTWALIKRMEQESSQYALGIGHCHGCRSKKLCTVLHGEACVNPHQRHYSVEATGVECSALNELLYGRRLPWWFKAEALPAEMHRYAGLFTNDNLDGFLESAIRKHRSLIPAEDVAAMPEYEMAEVEAPAESQDAGRKFLMYVDFEDGLVPQEV